LWYGRCASTSCRLFLPPGVSDFWGCPPASWSLTTCHRNPLSGSPSLEVLCITPYSGTGILTGCPSPTLFSLGLGPTNPTRTDLPSETLDYRRQGFSPCLRYLCQHPHSRPLQHTLPVCLHRWRDALLPLVLRQVPSFGAQLEPRYIFRAVAFDQ
jgi:hypothetical protein